MVYDHPKWKHKIRTLFYNWPLDELCSLTTSCCNFKDFHSGLIMPNVGASWSVYCHPNTCSKSCWCKAFYSSRPGSDWDFTHVRLIFMNDSFIKCLSSILKYWRNILITEENEWINQPHSVVHPGLYCSTPRPWLMSLGTASTRKWR